MCFLTAMTAMTAHSQDRLSFNGDFRSRIELDRASDKSDGTTRDNRDRVRMRARLGLTYSHSDRLSIGMRVRTGNPGSIQSPHVTLGDGFSTKSMMLDKAYARLAVNKGWFWIGKNSQPFWQNNEMFWDDDVTVEGFATAIQLSTLLEARGGFFFLDAPQSNGFADQSHMLGGQLIASRGITTVSLTVRSIRENASSNDVHLADLNYLLISGNVTASLTLAGRPVQLGFDFISNEENYDSSLFNHDQTAGVVGSVRWGSTSDPRDWQFKYTYARIEKYAVVAGFAQDDWVRWGSATSTRSSNFSGHEFRAVFVPGARQNITARLYLVEGIAHESATSTSLETGTRLRVDWNISF